MVLSTKLWVFLKERHKGYTVNQENQKQKKSVDKVIKAIKYRIIRDIRNHFEEEKENYYQPVRKDYFWNNSFSKYEAMMTEIKPYQWKTTLMKLKHTWKTS